MGAYCLKYVNFDTAICRSLSLWTKIQNIWYNIPFHSIKLEPHFGCHGSELLRQSFIELILSLYLDLVAVSYSTWQEGRNMVIKVWLNILINKNRVADDSSFSYSYNHAQACTSWDPPDKFAFRENQNPYEIRRIQSPKTS